MKVQKEKNTQTLNIKSNSKENVMGTHVRSLAETLPIQIRKVEKVRGNVRLEFVCGSRASRRARQDFRLLQEMARQTATAIDKLPEHLAALKERLTDAEKERERLTQDLAQREGREAYATAAASADGLRRVFWEVEKVTETVRAKALAFAGAGEKALVMVIGKQPAGVLIACSTDAGIDAGAVLKQTLAEVGGRGGGAATLAQGSVPNEAAAMVLAQKLGLP